MGGTKEMKKENVTLLPELKLKTGKKVILREPEVGDQEAAAENVTNQSDNQFVFGMNVQKELIKMLLISIDGKKLSGTEKENLKGLFTLQEYNQLILGVSSFLDRPEMPQINFVKIS